MNKNFSERVLSSGLCHPLRNTFCCCCVYFSNTKKKTNEIEIKTKNKEPTEASKTNTKHWVNDFIKNDVKIR